MDSQHKHSVEKDIILFVGPVNLLAANNLRKFATKRKLKLAVIYNQKEKNDSKIVESRFDIVIPCDTSSHIKITQALLPYKDDLLAVSCRSEKSIPTFQKIIPHVPYLRTPTTESLGWSIDKIMMRRKFSAYDKKITPSFTLVHDYKKSTLKKIEEKIGFPLVVKPAGLAQSILVSMCFHKEELEKVLRVTFKKIKKALKDYNKENLHADVLVEQFMEGEMYSVDAYVTSRGKVYFCPFVHIKTGKSVGFDDFFGYQQITPTLLKKPSIEYAEKVAVKAIHALGLRSTTAHIELMRTESGWKVVEVGPRTGGSRDDLYEFSYGIDHAINDVLIRIPEKPQIPKKVKGYTAFLKFFGKKEGKIIKLTGIKKAQELKSFKSIMIRKGAGDRNVFAKNGGKSIFNITLFNPDRSKLLADIRRLETMINIETE